MKNLINCPFDEMMIYSKNLEVPRSAYQRELNPNRVRKIAAEFDEHIANDPKVSFRDGHYYVFDGQHTIAARKLRNGRRTCTYRGSTGRYRFSHLPCSILLFLEE